MKGSISIFERWNISPAISSLFGSFVQRLHWQKKKIWIIQLIQTRKQENRTWSTTISLSDYIHLLSNSGRESIEMQVGDLSIVSWWREEENKEVDICSSFKAVRHACFLFEFWETCWSWWRIWETEQRGGTPPHVGRYLNFETDDKSLSMTRSSGAFCTETRLPKSRDLKVLDWTQGKNTTWNSTAHILSKTYRSDMYIKEIVGRKTTTKKLI